MEAKDAYGGLLLQYHGIVYNLRQEEALLRTVLDAMTDAVPDLRHPGYIDMDVFHCTQVPGFNTPDDLVPLAFAFAEYDAPFFDHISFEDLILGLD